MAQRTGFADLPLHGGRIPAWLGTRMSKLGRVIAEAIVHHYGQRELLARLAHPFWFQSFGAVMGMDWHSSGITTSVIGALKRGLAPVQDELGIYVCGGRGKHSRETPGELIAIGERTGADGSGLARTSRVVAKVDSAAVQDGFSLYLHGFILSAGGDWTVVQQGMLPERKLARRYHWKSEGLQSFVDDPHAAIEGEPRGTIINLADARAAHSRAAQLEVLARGPDHVLAALKRPATERSQPARAAQLELALPALEPLQQTLPHLALPAHHDLREEDVVTRRLRGTLAAAADRGPSDFVELLLCPGVGARTVEALAHVAEVIHGAPCRFSDPGRFSLAHGGKDGHPFPVPLRVYDQTIGVLRQAVDNAKLGNDERLSAIRELDRQARLLERVATEPNFDDYVARERQASPAFDGKTV
ncbi:MAG TPA: DUF763 domain-containing protein [Polyangiaceae bacterium]|nr:DUF763 domain-containing protein [Polyangiaceae bacterium]